MAKAFNYTDITLHSISEYWNSIKPESNIAEAVEEAWKAKAEFLDNVSAQNNVVVFVTNNFTNRFVYMSDKVKILSGIDPALYLAESGLEFSISRMHPDQTNAVLKLLEIGFLALNQSDAQTCRHVELSLNYLYKNGNNEYMQVLQRGLILEVDESGRPKLSISFVHYVGHIKKHDSVGLAVTRPEGVTFYSYNKEEKCIDPPYTFTEQEKKIMLLLAAGHDTKDIAQKLFISPHTVDTHRRNFIKKADCIDTTGVVDFARLINLI